MGGVRKKIQYQRASNFHIAILEKCLLGSGRGRGWVGRR